MTVATKEPVTLTLVICTLNRPHCVERLLHSTLQSDRVPDEILVIDASAKSHFDVLASKIAALDDPRVRHLVVEEEHRGLTRQRNVGIRAARGEMIAFLDDDCVPSPSYFSELLGAIETNPAAVGVGGWIDEGQWSDPSQTSAANGNGVSVEGGWINSFGWRRRVGLRWRLRRALGLAPPLRPGAVPAEGHGWPIAYLSPTAGTVTVDCFMGGASLWRRSLFGEIGFSSWFEGYGLYEDLDFCLRAREYGQLLVASTARVAHLHEPSGRPRPFHYGRMVVVNGWRVWRRGNPSPTFSARLRWWMITELLILVRASNGLLGPDRFNAMAECLGRMVGMLVVMVAAPSLNDDCEAPLAASLDAPATGVAL